MAFVTAQAAAHAVTVAQSLALNIPGPVIDAEEWIGEVARLASTADPPRPPLPDRPDQLASVVHDHVTAVHAAARSRNVAATYIRDANERLITAVRAAVPAWISEMIPQYSKARDVFTDSAPRIPDGTTPDQVRSLTPAQFRHWQKADKAAYQLDALVQARREYEKLIAEPVTGRFADLAAASHVTDIPDGRLCRTTWEQVSAGLKVWRTKGDPVTRWCALLAAADQAALGLSLAEQGTLQTRADRYEAWLQQMLATAGRAFATT